MRGEARDPAKKGPWSRQERPLNISFVKRHSKKRITKKNVNWRLS
jgi:hypothetical protein